ncbi:FlgD immunoglobulin-like domain containing protein, partial [candidate division KSB1 bacterium]
NPEIVGSCPINADGVYEFQVSGDYAYVAGITKGLFVIDISDPVTPFEAACYKEGDLYATSVYISGNYAYVAMSYTNRSGLYILDISSPANPVFSGFIHTLEPEDVYAYLAERNGGLDVVDISNPENPVKVCSFGDMKGIEVIISGEYAYLRGINQDFHIIDISDLSNITEICKFEGMRTYQMVISGNYLFSANVSHMKIVDISSRSNPVDIFKYYTPGESVDIKVINGIAFLEDNGVSVLDVNDPANPFILGRDDISRLMDITNDYLYAINYAYWDNKDNLHCEFGIYDIADPGNPEQAGEVMIDLYPEAVDVVGNYAYMAGENKFSIYDVSSPSMAVKTASLVFQDRYPFAISVSGEYAFISCGGSGGYLKIINIEDPYNPVEVSDHPLINWGDCLWVYNGYAYVGCPRSLEIIDVRDPAAPVDAAYITTYTLDVRVMGDYAYALGKKSLNVFNVSDPTNPVEEGFFNAGLYDGRKVEITGEHIYVVDRFSGLYILKDEYNPHYVPPDDRIAKTGILHPNFPNPFNPSTTIRYELLEASHVRMNIYNVMGQHIKTLFSGYKPEGEYTVKWDGTNDSGQKVSAGMYIYRLTAGNSSICKKMVLIK